MFKGALIGLGSVRGLITVPGAIALIVWLVAPLMLRLDRLLLSQSGTEANRLLQTDYETAIAILSTIAGAAITTLSLVYSLVLVVFTLAAGTIAPRLLRRFTNDRVNQATAGIFGGLFLYALTILHQTDQSFVPVLSIAVAFVLSAIAVLQLIFFVHTVSRSVTIDEEIAEISQQLESRLAAVVADTDDGRQTTDWDRSKMAEALAPKSGYIVQVDETKLLAIAEEQDLRIAVVAKPGTFLLEGQTLALVGSARSDDEGEASRAALLEAISIMPARGSAEDIEYSISVLLEIALRALSPGVNDTFTAIACVDRLSAAFLAPVQNGLRRRLLTDAEGTVRVEIPGLTVEDMVNTAFHPLRRAALHNLLMLQHIADALIRLHDLADEGVEPIFELHGRLILECFLETKPQQIDADFLSERLAPLIGDRSNR